jgi:hypothetical protein
VIGAELRRLAAALTAASEQAEKPHPAGPPRPSEAAAATKVDTAGVGDACPVRPLAVSPDQAAELLGISRDAFDRHVLPHLTYRRVGRRILIPVVELERWIVRGGRAA